MAALLLVAGGGWLASRGGSETTALRPETPPSANAASASASSLRGAAKPPAASPAPPSSAVAAPPPSASPSAAPRTPPIDVAACVTAMFPEDAFEREHPGFGFVCKQRDPRKGAIELESRLVRAQGKGDVTDGMKAWSILGWYEMAAFAFARTRCCPEARALETPLGEICEFDASLRRLAIVAHKGAPAAWEPQLDAYQKAVRCVINMKLQRFFEWKRPVQGPERSAFTKLVERARR